MRMVRFRNAHADGGEVWVNPQNVVTVLQIGDSTWIQTTAPNASGNPHAVAVLESVHQVVTALDTMS